MTTTADDLSDAAVLRELADNIFSSATEPVLDIQAVALPFDAALWSTLRGSGLSMLTTPEEHGGSGAGHADLAVVLESAGYHAAPVPLAEHDLLASWLARAVGLSPIEEPMTASVSSATLQGNRLATTLENVPWVAAAHCLVVAGNGFVAALRPGQFAVEESADIAGQPYGRVQIDVELGPDALRTTAEALSSELRIRGAYARSAQTCGALARALDMSCEHVLQRVQFGRPLAKFQAVQELISAAASAVALAKSASDFATAVVSQHGFSSRQAEFAVAVAKIESARAATLVSRNAHQAHGAIGFTLDHRLRHFTGRALAWRSEFGSQRFWETTLGRMALESDSTVWELVTALSSPPAGPTPSDK